MSIRNRATISNRDGSRAIIVTPSQNRPRPISHQLFGFTLDIALRSHILGVEHNNLTDTALTKMNNIRSQLAQNLEHEFLDVVGRERLVWQGFQPAADSLEDTAVHSDAEEVLSIESVTDFIHHCKLVSGRLAIVDSFGVAFCGFKHLETEVLDGFVVHALEVVVILSSLLLLGAFEGFIHLPVEFSSAF